MDSFVGTVPAHDRVLLLLLFMRSCPFRLLEVTRGQTESDKPNNKEQSQYGNLNSV
jgi:hypothetical protein